MNTYTTDEQMNQSLAKQNEMTIDIVHTPSQHVERLNQKKQYKEAVHFTAKNLSKPKAVEWACQCVHTACDEQLSPEHREAIQLAEEWTTDPSETNRLRVVPAVESIGLGSPAGCIAAAVAFSGGSLGPPHVEPIPPDEGLTAKAVVGAVTMAAIGQQPELANERYQRFLDDAILLLNDAAADNENQKSLED